MAGDAERSLASVEVVAGIPESDRVEIEKRCKWREYARRELIIDRDSDMGDVYFVVTGSVRVVNYSLSGREVSYADVPAGGFFGEMAPIDGKPRSANVVASKKSLVASLSPEVFLSCLGEYPSFSLAIMKRLVAIVRGSTDRIMDLTTLGAHARVYSELLRLAQDEFNDEDYSASIEKLPTHSELASRASTTRETVARAISNLARNKIVEKRGGGLFIPDVMELEDIVEGGAE
jgi:CRP/FNR family cyclic AMP-dependent transcriptional regulator